VSRRPGPVGAAATALILSGCAGGGLCAGRDVVLRNASALPVEQAYFGTGAPDGWGADLLAGRPGLTPGATATLRASGGAATARALRVVWSNGRAAELAGVDACRFGQVVVLDGAMRPE
jgi:hypothetical protein